MRFRKQRPTRRQEVITDEHELAYWEHFSDETQTTITRNGKFVEHPGFRQEFRFNRENDD